MAQTKKMQLAPHSGIPLYTQLWKLLRERILDGTYPPLSRLPSENGLMRYLSISRITVRQALNDLQKEGLIYKRHGKGTFVTQPKAFQNVTTLQGLAESLSQHGFEVTNQLHSFKYITASKTVAEKLHLTDRCKITEIKRVRLINREPISLEITWLPQEIGIKLEKADLMTRDIFLILENDCGIPLGHADLTINAVLAEGDLVHMLPIKEKSPVMRIERLTYDTNGTPIDFEHLYYRGDAFQYQLRIDRERRSST